MEQECNFQTAGTVNDGWDGKEGRKEGRKEGGGEGWGVGVVIRGDTTAATGQRANAIPVTISRTNNVPVTVHAAAAITVTSTVFSQPRNNRRAPCQPTKSGRNGVAGGGQRVKTGGGGGGGRLRGRQSRQ